jgi:hypothetical protein
VVLTKIRKGGKTLEASDDPFDVDVLVFLGSSWPPLFLQTYKPLRGDPRKIPGDRAK